MNYCVYKHTFPNGKVYIGITRKRPEYRWDNGNGYLGKKKNGEYGQPLMAYAILKYGWENVIHEILYDGLSKEEAEQKEIELIKKYKSNQREFGYNIANGGNTIGTISKDTRQKISESQKGKKLSEEHKKKLIDANTGRKLSEETKKKISEARIGKYGGENSPNYGKHLSEETKRKISEALSGENSSWYGKHHTEETKRKISEAQKGEKNWNYGKSASEETRKKMSEAQKGRKHTEETKRKLRDCNIGENNPMYGKDFSEEHRKKISESNKGKKRSEETKQKISESIKKSHNTEEFRNKMKEMRIGDKNPFYGKHHSEEHKKKMSEANKGEKNPNYGKHLSEEQKKKISEAQSKKCICVETGEIFNSMTDAANSIGVKVQSISAACNGRSKTSGGYHWEFIEEQCDEQKKNDQTGYKRN